MVVEVSVSLVLLVGCRREVVVMGHNLTVLLMVIEVWMVMLVGRLCVNS